MGDTIIDFLRRNFTTAGTGQNPQYSRVASEILYPVRSSIERSFTRFGEKIEQNVQIIYKKSGAK
jgi:hypothetical protein